MSPRRPPSEEKKMCTHVYNETSKTQGATGVDSETIFGATAHAKSNCGTPGRRQHTEQDTKHQRTTPTAGREGPRTTAVTSREAAHPQNTMPYAATTQGGAHPCPTCGALVWPW